VLLLHQQNELNEALSLSFDRKLNNEFYYDEDISIDHDAAVIFSKSIRPDQSAKFSSEFFWWNGQLPRRPAGQMVHVFPI
jgi:hypothetical protein